MNARYQASLASGDQAEFDEFLSALNAKIADSLHRWWEMIAFLGRRGVLGDTGKVFGFEADPDAVASPIAVSSRDEPPPNWIRCKLARSTLRSCKRNSAVDPSSGVVAIDVD